MMALMACKNQSCTEILGQTFRIPEAYGFSLSHPRKPGLYASIFEESEELFTDDG